jgi:hypothetical protein
MLQSSPAVSRKQHQVPERKQKSMMAAVKSGEHDLVLIGDSITHTLQGSGGKYAPLNAVWERHFAPRRAINLGYNGYSAPARSVGPESGSPPGRLAP